MKTLLKFFLAANVLLQISLANEDLNQENPDTSKNPEVTSPSQEPPTEYLNQENPDTSKNPEVTSPSQEPTTEDLNQENSDTSKNPEVTSPSQEPTTEDITKNPEVISPSQEPTTEDLNQENPDTSKNPEETSPSQEPTTEGEKDSTGESSEVNYIYEKDIVKCESLSTLKKEVQESIINCHNDHRRNVIPKAANMLRLEWDNTLAAKAQKWADKCYLNHSRAEDRIVDGYPCGENVLVAPACVSWELVIEQWDNEKNDLEYNVGPINNQTTGHYTQIVNCNTYKMGCGMSLCKNGTKPFYVCIYFPAGNSPSRIYKPYDEGEPCSACKEHCDESKMLCLNFCKYPDYAANCNLVLYYQACSQFGLECYASCYCDDKIR